MTKIDGELRAGTSIRNNLIRALARTGRKQARLAEEFEITEARISQIVNRKDSKPEQGLNLKSRALKGLLWPWRAVRRR